jgi:hypothetical protein
MLMHHGRLPAAPARAAFRRPTAGRDGHPPGHLSRPAGGGQPSLAVLLDGLAAGFVGTALMTLGQEAERRCRGRDQGSLAAEIGNRLFGIRPKDNEEIARLSLVVHWSYGTISGVAYSFLDVLGLRGPGAVLVHSGLVWAGDTALLVRLGLVPLPWKRAPAEVTAHLVYRLILAVATSATYEVVLRRHTRTGQAS